MKGVIEGRLVKIKGTRRKTFAYKGGPWMEDLWIKRGTLEGRPVNIKGDQKEDL